MKTQAERIFAKFGGAPQLAKALVAAGSKRHISAVYRWNLPKASGGTGGVVPSSAMQDVLAAARLEGIVLTADDTFPGKL